MSDDDVTVIYGLMDPRDGRVRYVGKSDDPVSRLRDHMYDKRKCHRTSWLSNLKEAGLVPELVVLEVVPIADWQESERRYIAELRQAFDLTNGTDGGENPPSRLGCKQSAEMVEKRVGSMRGKPRSPAIRAKISAAKRGKPLSDSNKLGISLAKRGKPWSDKRRAAEQNRKAK